MSDGGGIGERRERGERRALKTTETAREHIRTALALIESNDLLDDPLTKIDVRIIGRRLRHALDQIERGNL